MSDWDDVLVFMLVIIFMVILVGIGWGLGANYKESEICKEIVPLVSHELYFEEGSCMITLDGKDLSVSDYYDKLTEKDW